jgi:hypothetical protein
VHPIHDAAVTRKNDRKAGICLLDEASMLANFSTGHQLAPVRLIQFSNFSERHKHGNQVLVQ